MWTITVSMILVIGSALALPYEKPDLNSLKNTERTGRIVGGENANIEDFPYQIALLVTETQRFSCGGSILNPTTVLTAVHCTYNRPPTDMFVRAGSNYTQTGGQLVNVLLKHEHPMYSSYTLDNDVAVLKLATALVFGPTVRAVDLPPRWFYLPDNTQMVLSGYGRLLSGGALPDVLQKAIVPVIANERCEKMYPYDVRKEHICAGKTGVDACQGDSGGPLVYNNYVIGVVSWGIGCAWEGYPTVYPRVSAYLSFIQNLL